MPTDLESSLTSLSRPEALNWDCSYIEGFWPEAIATCFDTQFKKNCHSMYYDRHKY